MRARRIGDYHAKLAINRPCTVRREVYLDHMTFTANAGPMFTEIFGPLPGLKDEWADQGASPGELDLSACRWRAPMKGSVPVATGFIGGFRERILREDEEYLFAIDGMGRHVKMAKKAATIAIPLEYPVKDMDDWRKFKHHYEFSEARFGDRWELAARGHLAAGRLLCASIPGGFDTPRQLLGNEGACLACYEQPELIHDILATVGETAERVLDRVSKAVQIDQLNVHEDMAGKSGPLWGPRQVGEFIRPYYRRIWDMLGERGARLFDQDSDGDMNPVVEALAAAETIDELEAYPWPSADWFDYAAMRPAAETRRKDQALKVGYMAPFYQHNKLRGLETSLTDPLLKPDFTRHLLGRTCDFIHEHHRRMFQACEGLIDLTEVTDDFGAQSGPLISLEVFREFYRPHVKRFIDLAHEFGIRVFHHDDGAIRQFLPDLVEMGIAVLNPIQWRCPGMEIEALKRDFGKAICFHGGVDNQQTLPFGSQAEVRAEVRRLIDVLAADGTGYVVAPCHNIQANTPLENIVALYDEAHHYGRF